MSDINELFQAIRLAETLATGVAREADLFPTETLTRVRESLASARFRVEELAISADYEIPVGQVITDERLLRAIAAISAVVDDARTGRAK